MKEHRYFFSAFCPLSAFRDHTFVLFFLVPSLGTNRYRTYASSVYSDSAQSIGSGLLFSNAIVAEQGWVSILSFPSHFERFVLGWLV